MAFSRQGNFLVSGSLDGSVRFWDLTGKQTHVLAEPAMQGITSVSLVPNGSRVFAAGMGKTWKAWNAENLEPAKIESGHTQSIVQSSISLTGNRMATIDMSGHVCLWDVGNGQLRLHLQLPLSAGYAVAYAPENTELLIGGNDHRLIRFAIPAYGQ